MNGSRTGMKRFSGSPVVSVVLCVIVFILLYFYWSVGNQLKAARQEMGSYKEAIKVLEDEKAKLENRVFVLTEDVKKESRLKRDMETKARSAKVQLEEAQMKLQSADTKAAEYQSSVESIRDQLDSKTEEFDQLTQQNMEKDSKIEDCVKEKEGLSALLKSQSSKQKTDMLSVEEQARKLRNQVGYLQTELKTEQAKASSCQHDLFECKRQSYRTTSNNVPSSPIGNQYGGQAPIGNQYSRDLQDQQQYNTRPSSFQSERQTQLSTPSINDHWETRIEERGKTHEVVEKDEQAPPELNNLLHNFDGNNHDQDTSQLGGDKGEGNVKGEPKYDEESDSHDDLKKALDYEDAKDDEADQPANPGDDNDGGPPNDYGNNGVNADNGDVGGDNGDNDDNGDNGDTSDKDGGEDGESDKEDDGEAVVGGKETNDEEEDKETDEGNDNGVKDGNDEDDNEGHQLENGPGGDSPGDNYPVMKPDELQNMAANPGGVGDNGNGEESLERQRRFVDEGADERRDEAVEINRMHRFNNIPQNQFMRDTRDAPDQLVHPESHHVVPDSNVFVQPQDRRVEGFREQPPIQQTVEQNQQRMNDELRHQYNRQGVPPYPRPQGYNQRQEPQPQGYDPHKDPRNRNVFKRRQEQL